MKKTKIVSSLKEDITLDEIISMIREGVDVFRIDLNEVDLKTSDDFIKKIRNAEKKLNKIVGIMLDMEGPVIRLDTLKEEKVYLPLGKEVRFYNYHVVCNNTQLSTNYANLRELVNLEDVLILSYGSVKLKVTSIFKDNFICKVIEDGFIYSRGPIYIEGICYKLPYLSPTDKENILYAIKNDIDFLALSYVRDEQDILSVVDLLIENGNEHMSILSKIENEQAYDNIQEILKVSDGVIVSRESLELNVDLKKIPYYQKEILKIANSYQKIGLVAGDLLGSMASKKTPTCAEVTDIYNAILDKSDGLILNSNITGGSYSVYTISMMRKIIEEAETNFPYQENLDQMFKNGKQDVTTTIAYSVVNSGILLNANSILANTMSGYTARKISYFRPKSFVLGLSPNKSTARSLTLNYGIIPVLVKKYEDTDQIVSECIQKYKEIKEDYVDDIVIITGGLPVKNKNTDFMKIEKLVD